MGRARNTRINLKRRFIQCGLPPVTANGTANWFGFAVPEHPQANGKARLLLKRLSYATRVVAVSTLGTVLFNVFKKRGATQTQLVTSFSLEGLTADDDTVVAFDAAITAADRTLQGGDVVYGTIVSNNADATGPTVLAHVLTVEVESIDVLGEPFFDIDGEIVG